MSPAELAHIARRYDRTFGEATQVFQYILEVLMQPRPEGVDLAAEWVRPLMELSASQAELEERRAEPAPGAWLRAAKRLGEALR